MKLKYEVIREERRRKGLSVWAFADQVGFSGSYISQLERGLITPSVSALQKIADALGISTSSLFEDDSLSALSENGYCEIVRGNERKSFRYPHCDVDYELLSPSFQCKIEMIHTHAKPGQSSPSFKHVGEEAVLVIAGTLDLWVADKHWVLHPGDCAYYQSHLPHHWTAIGSEELHLVTAVTPPSF